MKPSSLIINVLLVLLLLVGGYFGLINLETKQPPLPTASSPAQSIPSPGESATGNSLVEQAYADRLSNQQVQVAGWVTKLLPDDRDGSRHQRFIMRLDSGLTLLVAHNIDLAPRVQPLAVDDLVELYGVYEWNEQGGVIHWTHHDPHGKHPDGWILHQGHLYE
ncbi:MAG: DUF3465 domain-containing protein [Candidatus Thiodiazotropha sp.]|jgi:hypothetical protein